MSRFKKKAGKHSIYRIISVEPYHIATEYIGKSLFDSGHDGVNGGFFSRSRDVLNIHYTKGQSVNQTSQPNVNSWTFYITDDEQMGCTNALTISELEGKVGQVYFAVGGKDFNRDNYKYGGKYFSKAYRTLIAQQDQKVHLIQTVKKVTIPECITDLNIMGYDLNTIVNLDGGGSSQMAYNSYDYDPSGKKRAVPFIIKLK
ncbi:phosphodiester glycosidase family protein [Tenuibacillus multivorans]|uniref:Phosphodiester glycosidase domain-containing protein n=1 Tax=Tenuibacillus multivorans TaxID=237069 RepID=A0A1G9WGK6_9BACI|nr:phosphodiester glycosidase family protein [Tenuibacillus multivorans]GEL76455.1 hypothetical protein TMU01_06900 [Tenuibacillus multivorans]SDM83599.1 Predicted protein [Tenuibacillus multivorans]